MSDLLECVLRTMAGQDTMTAALFHGENEVSAPGYQPVPIRNWTVVGDELHAQVTFGPYDAPWEFDRYAFFYGDKLIESVPEDCLIRLPGDKRWTWQIALVDECLPELRAAARAFEARGSQ